MSLLLFQSMVFYSLDTNEKSFLVAQVGKQEQNSCVDQWGCLIQPCCDDDNS